MCPDRGQVGLRYKDSTGQLSGLREGVKGGEAARHPHTWPHLANLDPPFLELRIW